jgi:hypothetical protein
MKLKIKQVHPVSVFFFKPYKDKTYLDNHLKTENQRFIHREEHEEHEEWEKPERTTKTQRTFSKRSKHINFV